MALDLSELRELWIERAKAIHQGKSAGELSPEAINQTYKNLNQGLGSTAGDLPTRNTLLMQRNVYRFSGAKDHAMLMELNNKLVKDGKQLPWDEFKKEALKLNSLYNENHLQAEYQTAQQSGKMAALWESLQRNKKRFPNLKYKTQEDSRVRDEHRKLNNIIAPIDDAFWKKYYPPNGWRCRCYVVQTADASSKNIPQSVPEIKPEFEMNVGLSNQVYNESGKKPHPYFQLAKRDLKSNQALRSDFERNKLSAPKTLAYKSVQGAKVEVSVVADLFDYEKNFTGGKLIADQIGHDVEIRPDVKIDGVTNPEYVVNELVADRYEGSIRNAFKEKPRQIKNYIKYARKNITDSNVKDVYAIVVDISQIQFDPMADARLINGKFKVSKDFQSLYIIYNKKVALFGRGNTYEEILKKLQDLKK